MHVLVLDHNHTNGLVQALRLSSFGLVVETVPDVEEAARRLTAMEFDAVFFSVAAMDAAQRRTVRSLRDLYPGTEFYSMETIEDFLKRIRMDASAT